MSIRSRKKFITNLRHNVYNTAYDIKSYWELYNRGLSEKYSVFVTTPNSIDKVPLHEQFVIYVEKYHRKTPLSSDDLCTLATILNDGDYHTQYQEVTNILKLFGKNDANSITSVLQLYEHIKSNTLYQGTYQ